MSTTDWSLYRQVDGTLDLVAAYTAGTKATPWAVAWLTSLQKIRPISSRQAAAVALATCAALEAILERKGKMS